MSTTIAFDTHAYVKKLCDAGVDELQAEIQADALIALVEDRLATKQDVFMLKRDLAEVEANLKRDLADVRKDIVTTETNLKRDLADVKADLKRDLADVRKDIVTIETNLKRDIRELDGKIETTKTEILAKVDTKIESAKVDTIKWTAGMFAAQTALIIGALFAIMKMNQPSSQPTGYHTPPVQETRLPAPSVPAPPTPERPRVSPSH